MPFTTYHFGPALAIGLILRRWLHAPTLIVASVVLDIEPFLVITFGLGSTLHGMSHTFIAAIVSGIACGLIMRALESRLAAIFRALGLETEGKWHKGEKPGIKSFVTAGAVGAALHVILDAPLYPEMQPFFPLAYNPLYMVTGANVVYSLCLWLGVASLIAYTIMLILRFRRGSKV